MRIKGPRKSTDKVSPKVATMCEQLRLQVSREKNLLQETLNREPTRDEVNAAITGFYREKLKIAVADFDYFRMYDYMRANLHGRTAGKFLESAFPIQAAIQWYCDDSSDATVEDLDLDDIFEKGETPAT